MYHISTSTASQREICANRRINGFTLVELSIVLVIIGLIIGGITGAVQLRKALELRALVADAQRYETVIQSFKLRYSALPGDMPNATDIWGWAPTASAPVSTNADCLTLTWTGIPGEGKRTCNGNGNGRIDQAEPYRIWQHLGNAEMIEGGLTGTNLPVPDGSLTFLAPGENCPAFNLSSRTYCWHISYTPHDSNAHFTSTLTRHSIALTPPLNFLSLVRTVFTAREMHEIDLKFDDGMPATGRIYTQPGTSSAFDACTVQSSGAGATSIHDTDALYNTADSTTENLRECAFFVHLHLH